ncbi:hypothetical protein [Wenxinia saemankumensis]|uniref:Uncharacterized protein n=1 Tax=Wenxinia saemankumensis TaxID=1447782 RepID=A0A1M6API2_9RHOB|nr:hypothetical protein [Wenxinia saemankumensis]SHI38341.1 hypothetical protein SAMN05444417_0550 [Wenxinia saemankumensis]
MKDIAFRFFAAGAICVTIGMAWGIQMAASQNHMMVGAHAHLNLVGWVTLGLFGLYYRTTPAANASRLAGIHFVVAVAGVVLLVPGIALATSGGSEILAIVGSFVTIASMLTFLVVLFRYGFGAEGTVRPHRHAVRPAE